MVKPRQAVLGSYSVCGIEDNKNSQGWCRTCVGTVAFCKIEKIEHVMIGEGSELSSRSPRARTTTRLDERLNDRWNNEQDWL